VSKRRAKGEGSVYIRKDGRVVAEWTDAHGRARYMTSTKMSKTEMSTAIRKKLQERDEGITHDSENLTVAEYVDRWLESTRDTVGLRTYQRSESSAKLHLVPTLGRVKLEKLTAMQLDKLYREKLKAGFSPRSGAEGGEPGDVGTVIQEQGEPFLVVVVGGGQVEDGLLAIDQRQVPPPGKHLRV
jgi:integrase